MSDSMKRRIFIRYLLPSAIEAIGKQHGALVRLAIGKAAQECGWNVNNVLIMQARNCLGIKGGVQIGGKWYVFPGVSVYCQKANTGPETGDVTPWRIFPTLAACFGELVRIWNDREPYEAARRKALLAFENIYTDGLNGHGEAVIAQYHAVTNEMFEMGMIDLKGRIA